MPAHECFPNVPGSRRSRPLVSMVRETVMDITHNGTRSSTKGPADFFTGQVRVDPLFSAQDPARCPIMRSITLRLSLFV